MVKDYPDAAQRDAVCHVSWRKAKKLQADIRDDGAYLVQLDAMDGMDGMGDQADAATPAPPTEFMLFADGTTMTTKGPIVCNATCAMMVCNQVKQDGRDSLPFDYGHGMLGLVQTKDSAKAAGWFVPAARGGELWATEIKWTPAALESFSNREFRYFSPAVMVDPDTREVTQIINCALTNLPATFNQTPLVADSRGNMDPDLKKLLVALGVENSSQAVVKFDSVRGENEKLVKAVTDMQVELTSAQSALKTFKDSQVKAEKDAFIVKLSADGKLSPALKDWANEQSLESLQKFSANAPVVTGATVESRVSAPTNSLNDDQKKVCVQLGITEESFLKQLSIQSAQPHPMMFVAEVSK